MYPSTLCNSFPKRPQGLKLSTHFSPVLQAEQEGTNYFQIFLLFELAASESTHILNLLVVSYFHISVLLNPKFAHNDVMHTASRICPCVGFIVSVGYKNKLLVSLY